MDIPVRWLLLMLAFILLMFPAVSAHQPRLVMGWDIHTEQSALFVPEPEVSKAYYGELSGKPDYYRISLQEPARIYLGLLAPFSPDSRTDLTAEIYDYKDNSSMTQVILLDGSGSEWEPIYEPFGGDWYLQGPETRENLTNVTYYIKVSSPSNQGRYSLAIGEEESFTPEEVLSAYVQIPLIKQLFFGKPVLLMLFMFLGIAMGMGSLLSASVILFTFDRPRLRSAANAFGKLRYPGWIGIVLSAASLTFALFQNPMNLLGILASFILLLIALLLVHAGSRAERIENRVPASLKFTLPFSLLLWLAFLLLAVAML